MLLLIHPILIILLVASHITFTLALLGGGPLPHHPRLPSSAGGRGLRLAGPDRRQAAGIVREDDAYLRSCVKFCDTMFVIPLVALKIDKLASLKDKLPPGAKSVVGSKRTLMEALDGSPLAQCIPDLTESSFAIFTKASANGDDNATVKQQLFKWWKELKEDQPVNTLICFKDRYINLIPEHS